MDVDKLPPGTETPVLLTIPQVADRLRLGVSSVYKLLNSGELPSCRIRGNHRVSVGQLTEYVQRLEREASGRT
jgi:excisionase family DNA binding protein